MNNGNNNRMWIPIVVILVGVFIVVWFVFGNQEKQSGSTAKHSYSSTSGTTSSASRKCAVEGCNNEHKIGGRYCYLHTCEKLGCNNRVALGSTYCAEHKPNPYIINNSNNHASSGNKKTDDYNIKDYDDVDDFYEDYYYDFEDFDEAEQYWDENH